MAVALLVGIEKRTKRSCSSAVITPAFVTAAVPALAQFDLVNAKAPVAAKKPKDVTVHEDKRIDDYFWLREKGTPEVVNYLEQENAYTEAVLAPAKALRSSDDVAEARQQKKAQQAALMAAEQAPNVAGAVKDLAQAKATAEAA